MSSYHARRNSELIDANRAVFEEAAKAKKDWDHIVIGGSNQTPLSAYTENLLDDWCQSFCDMIGADECDLLIMTYRGVPVVVPAFKYQLDKDRGMALVPELSLTSSALVEVLDNQLHVVTYVGDRSQADITALFETHESTRTIELAEQSFSAKVFKVVCQDYDDQFHPVISEDHGKFLHNHVDGTSTGADDARKWTRNRVVEVIERIVRKESVTRSPYTVNQDEQTFWIKTILQEGRRLFQIVNTEGEEMLDAPVTHRGEVFAQCLKFNHEYELVEADDE